MSKWEMLRLGDVCTLKSGNSLSDDLIAKGGSIPYIKVADLNLSENTPCITMSSKYANRNDVNKQIFPSGTVVFPKRGGAIGTNKKRLTSCEICADLNIMGVIPSERIDKTYLYMFFQNIDMGRLTNGSSVPQINNSDIAPLQIPLPPLDVQKQIADTLDKVSRLIELRKTQLEKMDLLIKSKFIDMFGDPVTNPMGWGVKAISDCCILNPKKSEVTGISDDFYISFIPMQNISEDGSIDVSDARVYEDVKSGFTYFAEGDVLFAKITPCMENGKGAIAKGLKNGIGFGSTEFHILRPKETVSNSEWLYYLTRLPVFRINAESNMTGSAGQKRVPLSFFKKFLIPLPPLSLQTQFSGFVEEVEHQKAVMQKSLVKMEMQYKALMQEYFG